MLKTDTAYAAALAASNAAAVVFAEASRAYRAREIGDAEFLAARAASKAAEKAFDEAFAIEAARAELAEGEAAEVAADDRQISLF